MRFDRAESDVRVGVHGRHERGAFDPMGERDGRFEVGIAPGERLDNLAERAREWRRKLRPRVETECGHWASQGYAKRVAAQDRRYLSFESGE